jgi:hypothetical protein
MTFSTKGNLVCLLVPKEAIEGFWKEVAPKLGKSLENSHNEQEAEDIHKDLIVGQVSLWVLYERTEKVFGLKSMAITELITTPKGVWIVMMYGWSEGLKFFNRLFGFIEKTAEKNGARGVKIISSLPKMGIMAKRKGYEPRFVEYVKEVK